MTFEPADPACDQIEPLLAAYALGEQDPTVMRQIAAHLTNCPRCSEALAAYQRVARLLPLSAADAPPSVGLRERVIAAVNTAAQGAPGHQPTSPPRRQVARRAPPSRWAGRALGAALLVALLTWNLTLQQQLAAARSEQARQQAELAALLSDGTPQIRALTAEPIAAGATGSLVLAPDRSDAALVVAGLPPLPATQVYQLWLVADEQRISGGTFTVDSSGSGLLLVHPPLPLAEYDRVGVTVEPQGGSPGPTSPRVIGAQLP